MKVTREQFYDAASDSVHDWDDLVSLPFDVPAAITALGAVESGFDTMKVGDGGTSLGALQVHTPSFPWATASYLVMDLYRQLYATRPAFADALAYVRRIRTVFSTKPGAYDPRDEVKWMNLVWQFGGPFALAWAKASSTSDPVQVYTTAELRNRYDAYLTAYNRAEDRAAHPWVTAARDALAAQRDAMLDAIRGGVRDGVSEGVTRGVEMATATVATPLLILLLFVAVKHHNKRRG